jgi:hypothetical protein
VRNCPQDLRPIGPPLERGDKEASRQSKPSLHETLPVAIVGAVVVAVVVVVVISLADGRLRRRWQPVN